MDSEKIIQDLNRRFAAPLPEFYKHRIIVWIAEDQRFTDWNTNALRSQSEKWRWRRLWLWRITHQLLIRISTRKFKKRCCSHAIRCTAQWILRWFRHTGTSAASLWNMSKMEASDQSMGKVYFRTYQEASAGIRDRLLCAESSTDEEVLRHVPKYERTAFAIDVGALSRPSTRRGSRPPSPMWTESSRSRTEWWIIRLCRWWRLWGMILSCIMWRGKENRYGCDR